MAISKLTTKYQATIPAEVRTVLHLEAGDTILFRLNGTQVHVEKASKLDIEWHNSVSSTLSEWNNPAEDDAFAKPRPRRSTTKKKAS